jgi:hypothetical protein
LSFCAVRLIRLLTAPAISILLRIVFTLHPVFRIIGDVFPEPIQIVFITYYLIVIVSLPDYSNFIHPIFHNISKIFNNTSGFECAHDGTQRQKISTVPDTDRYIIPANS